MCVAIELPLIRQPLGPCMQSKCPSYLLGWPRGVFVIIILGLARKQGVVTVHANALYCIVLNVRIGL